MGWRRSIYYQKGEDTKWLILAANSVVTKEFINENSVIAGNPAKEVKRNIYWSAGKNDH